MSEQAAPINETTPLEGYASYPFSSDDTYQQGLASLITGGILQNKSPSEKDEILRRTRVFYFNSATGNSLSMDEAREYELSLRSNNKEDELEEAPADATHQPTSNQDEGRVLTFAELQQLIESGRVDQIPNNKSIPDLLNDASPSQSTAPARKKPWELTAVDV